MRIFPPTAQSMMRHDLCAVLAIAAFGVFLVAPDASFAGGFSGQTPWHGPTGGQLKAGGSATGSNTAKDGHGATLLSSDTFADAAVLSLYGGSILEAGAVAGQRGKISGYGKFEAEQKNKAKTKVYVKGKNIMAKARSATHTKLKIDGKTYIVADEVARAMARFTPLGTTAAADSEAKISVKGNGYLGVVTNSTNESTVRVQN